MSQIKMPLPDVSILERKEQLISGLKSVIDSENVITDPLETIVYECDALTAYRCPPLAVTLPQTTEEVAAILKYCHHNNLPVIPRGAGTSLAGGALPTADSIVIGVARLNSLLEVDLPNRFIRVQAGITNLAVSQAVSGDNFFYAPDPSSQLACAIAGNIAMNSGGAHCLKYGVTTNNLMGVRMVTMEGEILDVGGAHLDPAGYDLLGIICGSEGQFGIVTEATLRILGKPEGARPILMGFNSNEVAGACVADIIKAGLLPVALEFMDRPAVIACENFAKAGYPTDVEALLIVEVEGSDSEIDDQLEKIREIARRHNPEVLRESESALQSDLIWKGRKAAFGAMGQISDYMCMDGTIPTSQLPNVLGRMQEMAKQYGLRVANVFHAGDGNLHPLILFDANKPGDQQKCEDFGSDILKLCVEVGGCLTGEHGVGIEKRELMNIQFNEQDLEMQMRLKDVFDPKWLLNAAKVFPTEISQSRRRRNSRNVA